MSDLVLRLVVVVASAIAGLSAAVAIGTVVHRSLGRRAIAADLLRRTRIPFRVFATALGVSAAIRVPGGDWGWSIAGHITTLVLIGAGAWLLTGLLFVIEDSAVPRLNVSGPDNRHARAIRTQMLILRRVTAVVVAVFALGAALMTFREARLLGTSVLASAGVAAAIAAFATNALLGNIIAGVQIAFSGSLRLDDVVVVEEQWGRIEEITLTYVVVRIWDDRRLILPTSYFTTQPFQNWTHQASAILGEATIDVDWSVDIDALRSEVESVVRSTSLWDGRVCNTQVIGATGGRVTVRAVVSASDASHLWDLRCLVREALVRWVRDNGGPPRTRAELQPAAAANRPVPGMREFAGDADVATSSAEAGSSPCSSPQISPATNVSPQTSR